MAYKTDGPRAHTRGLITEECKSVLAERATRKAPPSQTEDGAPENSKAREILRFAQNDAEGGFETRPGARFDYRGVQKRSRRKNNPKSPTLTNRGWGTEKLKPALVEGADLVVQEREFGLVVVLGAGLLDLGLSLIQLGLA